MAQPHCTGSRRVLGCCGVDRQAVRVPVVSQPFFLGSPEHGAAIAALPDYDYEHSYEDIHAFADIPVLAWHRDDDITVRVTARSGCRCGRR